MPLLHELRQRRRKRHGQVLGRLVSGWHAHLLPQLLAPLAQLEGHGTEALLETGEVIAEGDLAGLVAAEEGQLAGHEDGEGGAEGEDVGFVGDGVAEHGGRAAVLVGDASCPGLAELGVGGATEVDDCYLWVVGDFDVVFLVQDLFKGGGVALRGEDEVFGLVGFAGFLVGEGGGEDDFGVGAEDEHDLFFVEELEALDLGEDVVGTEVAVVDAEGVEGVHSLDDAAAETPAVELGVHVGGHLDVASQDGDDVAEVATVGTGDPEVFVGDADLVLEGLCGAHVDAFEESG